MGAALTYARLVGITGEDDLDAPDLGADHNPLAGLPRGPDDGKQSNGQTAATQRSGDGTLPGLQQGLSSKDSYRQTCAKVSFSKGGHKIGGRGGCLGA